MALKRLLRRIRWLLITQWRSLTLRQWPYESCKVCGKAFRVRWDVDNFVWYKVMNVCDDGGGSLCIDCFIEKAEQQGVPIVRGDFCFDTLTPTIRDLEAAPDA